MMMPGSRIGRVTVVRATGERHPKTGDLWVVRCNGCQRTWVAGAYRIAADKAGGCPCRRRKGTDLADKRFGKLLVCVKSETKTNTGAPKWVCLCDCGLQIIKRHDLLLRGVATDCGCAAKALRKTRNGDGTKSSEYGTWLQMRDRCRNPNNKAFGNYGGRGIKVCAAWGDFDQFKTDLGARPSAFHSLERIDNSLGYQPDNCRWATRQEQQSNTRRTVWITFEGQTHTLKQWAAIRGIKYPTLVNRYRKRFPTKDLLAIGKFAARNDRMPRTLQDQPD